jgi:DNA-binding NtrC family response regulator
VGGTQAAAPRPSNGYGRVPHQVLVVDDEPGVRRLAARILYEEGYRVHEAVDGRDALDFIERGQTPLDAVVSDIVMPRLNGVQLLESLAHSHPDLPILLMSGYGIEELAQRDIASPCGVLEKPFTPEHLIAEVRRCISQRR